MTRESEYELHEREADTYAGDTGMPAVVLSYGYDGDDVGELVSLVGAVAVAYLDDNVLPAGLRRFDWVEASYTADPRQVTE